MHLKMLAYEVSTGPPKIWRVFFLTLPLSRSFNSWVSKFLSSWPGLRPVARLRTNGLALQENTISRMCEKSCVNYLLILKLSLNQTILRQNFDKCCIVNLSQLFSIMP